MSEPAKAAETQTPAPATIPTAPAKAPPAAAAPPAPAPGEPPPYLNDRLERERRSVLKQLGIKAPKGIPSAKAIEEAKAKIDGGKSQRKELRAAKDAAEAKAVELETKVAALKTFADMEIAALTPEQQTKVKSVAGDDPAEQLKVLALLKPSFAPQPAALAKDDAAAAAPPAQKQPAPAPATTAPAAAPPPTTTADELPIRERWNQVQSIADPNRRAASRAQFLLANGEALLDALTRT